MSSAYAHGHSVATVQGHADRTLQTSGKYMIPLLRPGLSVLDVGCGPGTITSGIADVVHPGRVVGIDIFAAVIDTARKLNNKPNLEFMVGSIFELPFDDETFDIVCTHQVLAHIPIKDQARAYKELRRVCKRNGKVASREGKPGGGGFQCFPPNALLDKQVDIVVHKACSSGSDPNGSSYLPRAARAAGFLDSQIERSFDLDEFCGGEWAQAFYRQWKGRSGEESFRKYALEHKLATEEELDGMVKGWDEWINTEDCWATFFQIQLICTK